VTQYDN